MSFNYLSQLFNLVTKPLNFLSVHCVLIIFHEPWPVIQIQRNIRPIEHEWICSKFVFIIFDNLFEFVVLKKLINIACFLKSKVLNWCDELIDMDRVQCACKQFIYSFESISFSKNFEDFIIFNKFLLEDILLLQQLFILNFDF